MRQRARRTTDDRRGGGHQRHRPGHRQRAERACNPSRRARLPRYRGRVGRQPLSPAGGHRRRPVRGHGDGVSPWVRRRSRRTLRRPRRGGVRVRILATSDVRRRPGSRGGSCDHQLPGAVSVGLAVANRLRAQDTGALLFFRALPASGSARRTSSTGRRRRGSTAFAQGLGDSLAGSGARACSCATWIRRLVDDRRPRPAPLSTTPRPSRQPSSRGCAPVGGRSGCAARCASCSPCSDTCQSLWRRLPLG